MLGKAAIYAVVTGGLLLAGTTNFDSITAESITLTSGQTLSNGDIIMEPATVNNGESPTPTTVRALMQLDPPAYDTGVAGETAALYINNDMTASPVTQFVNGIYIDQSPNQSIVGGAGIKCIHNGDGDCIYVAILGDSTSAYGYEAAMFGGWQDAPTDTVPKQENGFIATFQGSGGFQQSVKNQSNSVPFQALVHDDGFDPTDPDEWATNYGLFYANNSLSNAFRVRLSEYAENYPQFSLSDNALREVWSVYTDGQMWAVAPEADASTQNQNPPVQLYKGKYWDGDSEETWHAQLSYQVSGAPTPSGAFRFDMGDPGSETLALQLNDSGDATFAGNITNSGTTFRISGRRTPASSSEACNSGDFAFDTDYAYYCVATNTWKRSAIATW